MKRKLTLFTAAAIAAAAMTSGGMKAADETAAGALRFHDGTFRVVQFTDLHLKPGDATTDTTEATIRAIVAETRPDLAVVTGDVVCYDPATDGWRHVASIFEDLGLPFVVTLGNHDAEYLTKDSIYTLLMESPVYVGDKGPSEIYGCGNVVIPIAGADGRTAAAIYMIDSNDYQPERLYGVYDWIHFDQIAWYRDRSQSLARENGGSPVPSLMFYHIPVHEYAVALADSSLVGSAHEGAGAPSGLNSGLYASAVEMGDVMGMFAGHDHDNDFVAMARGLALGFGRCTGSEAYGSLPRGARVIDLCESARRFDTWTLAPAQPGVVWHYPSAINSAEEASMTYLPAVDFTPGEHGVAYVYYEGPFRHTTQIRPDEERSRGTLRNFDITGAPAADHFGYRFSTMLRVDERGVYRFYTYSDDGSVVRIDGVKVVDNDGGHSVRRREGKVALEPGFHRLDVDYYENYMGQELEVGFASVTRPEAPVPDSLLYLPPRR